MNDLISYLISFNNKIVNIFPKVYIVVFLIFIGQISCHLVNQYLFGNFKIFGYGKPVALGKWSFMPVTVYLTVILTFR